MKFNKFIPQQTEQSIAASKSRPLTTVTNEQHKIAPRLSLSMALVTAKQMDNKIPKHKY